MAAVAVVIGLLALLAGSGIVGIVVGARGMGRKAPWGVAVLVVSIVVTVLVFIAGPIGVITVFGNQLRDQFRVETERLGGDEAPPPERESKARSSSETQKGFGDLRDRGR